MAIAKYYWEAVFGIYTINFSECMQYIMHALTNTAITLLGHKAYHFQAEIPTEGDPA